MIRRLALTVTLCLLASLALAEIYKSIDENGKVIYTDNPRGNQKIEKVDLPAVNSQPATPILQKKSAPEAKATKTSLVIVSPANNAQIPTGQFEIPVRITVQPKLAKGQRIQLMLNDKAFGQPTTQMNTVLRNVFRGEHQLSAALLDNKGRVLTKSSAITLYVQRQTVNRP